MSYVCKDEVHTVGRISYCNGDSKSLMVILYKYHLPDRANSLCFLQHFWNLKLNMYNQHCKHLRREMTVLLSNSLKMLKVGQ